MGCGCRFAKTPTTAEWNLATRPEEYDWSSAKYYEGGIDDFGFLTHYFDET